MGKQAGKSVAKVAAPSKAKSTTKAAAKPEYKRELRSPKTNLVWALVMSAILMLVSNSPAYALTAGIFAFLFFNTVDYMIFYNRYKKGKL